MQDSNEITEKNPAIAEGKGKFKELIIKGNVSVTLHKVSDWTGYIQDAVNALEKITESARQILAKQGSNEEDGLQQPALAFNPAIFVNLLKAQEFQQVIAMLMVQFLKN